MKSNIGHPQAAAGMAGVIKMVLAIQHGLLPRTLHADEPSPHIDWSSGSVRLLAEAQPWPAGKPRSGGVSSFGMSGTNVHAIFQEPPAGEPAQAPQTPALPVLPAVMSWPVSARTADGLRAQAGRLAAYLTACPELDPADVGWSLATTRSVFEYRAVVLGTGREELLAGLSGLAAGQPGPMVLTSASADWARSRSCSPARDRSGLGWAGSWPGAARCSRPGWPSAAWP